MPETPSEALLALARSHGVQAEYVGMSGRTEPAPAGSLLAVLRALGVDVASEADVPRAARESSLSSWRKRVEPVVVAWDGARPVIEVRLPAGLAGSTVDGLVRIEGQAGRDWSAKVEPIARPDAPEGFVVGRLGLPFDLATGYHRLELDFEDGESAQTLIIAAPSRAYRDPAASGKRPWGVFCPLYALHRGSSWGGGDFSDLSALIEWTASQGGSLVATLPMLASNFDGDDPIVSPYSPTSRIFWNEFYLDLSRVPELAGSEAARDLLDSAGFQAEIAPLKGSGLVDYGRQMKLKRRLLELGVKSLLESEGERRQSFEAYGRADGEARPYALFQAAGERLGRDWRAWPKRQSPGPDEVDREAFAYHLYVQWLAQGQLEGLSRQARAEGMTWYLDFPIGVDFNSFDVWKYQDAFATGASVGCPPDPVFTKGQNWGFPPLHPQRQREHGYQYLIECIRAHFRHANALRIDHVMGLHRLFWIPQGAEAKDGAFVSTPSEEIYAILSVESHRHSAWLVGEDLGTVPPEVDGAMKRHNVRGMYVVQYEAKPDPVEPLREPPEPTVAGVNTHDMPPFAAFWGGLDLDDRKDLGLMSGETLEVERGVREEQRLALVRFLRSEGLLDATADDAGAVLRGLYRWLAGSEASVLLVNLEDLWLETESQNTPNTYTERPNWRRKIRHSFEDFAADPAIRDLLKEVDELRAGPAR